MTEFLLVLIVTMPLALVASAQDETPADNTTAAVDEAATEEQADIEDVEDADLDEQTYEQDEDDFVPTEEIPADEPIPFPTNI